MLLEKILVCLTFPAADFNAEKGADDGLSNFDLVYKYQNNIAEWYETFIDLL